MSEQMFSYGFIGAGRMNSALVKGLIHAGVQPAQIALSDGGGGSADKLAAETGAHSLGRDTPGLITRSRVVVLGCKPQVVKQLSPYPFPKEVSPLLVSVVAGVSIARLQDLFPYAQNWVRTMPNTPARVGKGITGWVPAKEISSEQNLLLQPLLTPLGKSVEIPEPLMDALTAISGSGPAYFFEFTRLLEESAKSMGIDADNASLLARATLIGAARLVELDERSLEELRNEVTSPGGTTAAALDSFAKSGLSDVVSQAVNAAAQRARDLNS